MKGREESRPETIGRPLRQWWSAVSRSTSETATVPTKPATASDSSCVLALADIPRLLRVAEAARVLAISPRKLWSLTDCGEIPCVRIGRSVRYDPVDLSNWIEAKKQREGGHNLGHRGQCS